MPTPPTLAVLLRLDGVLQASDLPVQAFARHLTEQLPAERVRSIIAGMRGFLEAKPDLLPAGFDLSDAEDGYQAVAALAGAMGLSADRIEAARRASRADLAASAWAVDPPDGLDDLLDALDGRAHLAVFTEPDDPAAAVVVAEIGIDGRVSEVVDDPLTTAVGRLLAAGGAAAAPARLLVIGTRWVGELDAAADAGCVTAMVDRFGRGRGAPRMRAADLAGLLDPVRQWVQAATRTTDSREAPG